MFIVIWILFVGDKIDDDYFKDEITPSLEANNKLEFSRDVSINHVGENDKTLYKL